MRTRGLEKPVTISRQQVHVLPNFAMTDYSSQGKNRDWNVVNISKSRTSNAVYTALSRATTAAGTLILTDFDSRKISGGISGHLRQEFRELEWLNCITKDRFYGKLQHNHAVELRKPTIREYRLAVGRQVTPDWHPALGLQKENTMPLESPEENLMWQHQNAYNFVVDSARKPAKKSRAPEPLPAPFVPLGPKWDADNWSCAYDSLISLFYNTWTENKAKFSSIFKASSTLLARSVNGFEAGVPLESIRDDLRFILHQSDPATYPTGRVGTDVYALGKDFVNKASFENFTLSCSGCKTLVTHQSFLCSSWMVLSLLHAPRLRVAKHPPDEMDSSVGRAFRAQLRNRFFCHVCQSVMSAKEAAQPADLRSYPDMVLLPVQTNSEITIDKAISGRDEGGAPWVYDLKGVVYYGDFHFVSHFLDNAKRLWIIDGQRTTVPDDSVLHELLSPRQGKQAVLLYYVRR